MKNPWLKIPASDYEAHMSLPEVAQAQALSKLMALALAEYTPASLAVVGCATGSGFEHIDTTKTRRVVGVDINPAYLNILRSRFAGRIPNLELIEADITAPDFLVAPVSMVFAGLVFEYVDVVAAFSNRSKRLMRKKILLRGCVPACFPERLECLPAKGESDVKDYVDTASCALFRYRFARVFAMRSAMFIGIYHDR